jgi:hypothetical protein
LALCLLTDYLLGFTSSGNDNDASTSPTQITRLVIAGNSLGESVTADTTINDNSSISKTKKQAPKKYGYDASSYNASPITHLDSFLAELLPSIPITLMPGETDPANFSLPQQEIHRAMLPRARAYCSDARSGDQEAEPGWLDSVTNPWEGDIEGWRLWGSSGQNVDDVLRYMDLTDREDGLAGIDDAGMDGDARLRVMEAMLRWRCTVPTAPDTLCMPTPPTNLLFVFIHFRPYPVADIHKQGATPTNLTIPSSSSPPPIYSSRATNLSSEQVLSKAPFLHRSSKRRIFPKAKARICVSDSFYCRNSQRQGSWCLLMRRRWRLKLSSLGPSLDGPLGGAEVEIITTNVRGQMTTGHSAQLKRLRMDMSFG